MSHSDHLAKKLEQIQSHFQRGRRERGVKELLQVLGEHPNDELLLVQAAEMLVAAGEPQVAATEMQKRFELASQRGDSRAALFLFHQLQRMHFQSPDRMLRLARVQERARQPLEAERWYRQAALGFQHMGALDRELEAWESLLHLRPANPGAYLEIAERAEHCQRPKLAAAALAQAAVLKREDPRLLAHAFELDPADRNLRARHARALLGQHRVEEAWAAFEPLLPLEAGEREWEGLEADLLLRRKEGERAWVTIHLHLHEGREWWERGLACFRMLAASAEPPPLMDMIAALEAEVGGEAARRLQWLPTLESALAHLRQEEALVFMAMAFARLQQPINQARALTLAAQCAQRQGAGDRAADWLEQAVQLDPYDPEAPRRVNELAPLLSPERLQQLRAPFGPTDAKPAAPEPPRATPKGSLEDLILQAELYVQYQLPDRAREQVRAALRLRPTGAAQNPRLMALVESLDLTEDLTVAAPPPAAAAGAAVEKDHSSDAPVSLTRIQQIVRAVHRESTPGRILYAAAQYIGRLWPGATLLAGRVHAGDEASNVAVCPGAEAPQLDAHLVQRLLATFETQLEAHLSEDAALVLPRRQEVPAITDLLREAKIASLLLQPLHEAGSLTGFIAVAVHRKGHEWLPGDRDLLDGLADQVLLALSNARLRSLLRQFSESDDRTGTLRFSSFLELLVAECARAREQDSLLSLLAIEVTRPPNGDAPPPADSPADNAFLEGIARRLPGFLRSGDMVAVMRPGAFLLLLPDTSTGQCGALLERIRGGLVAYAWPDGVPLHLIGGAAEMAPEVRLPESGFAVNPEDAATEQLDRALQALEQCRTQAGSPLAIFSAPPLDQVLAQVGEAD